MDNNPRPATDHGLKAQSVVSGFGCTRLDGGRMPPAGAGHLEVDCRSIEVLDVLSLETMRGFLDGSVADDPASSRADGSERTADMPRLAGLLEHMSCLRAARGAGQGGLSVFQECARCSRRRSYSWK